MRNVEDLTIAVVGATGAVGREVIEILAEREFPAKQLKLFASERSAGEQVSFQGKPHTVEELSSASFDGVDIAIFSAGGSVSREFAPVAAEVGTVVIDNSSCFRMDEGIELIVPEVNGDSLRTMLSAKNGAGSIIANPNCSTIQLVVALKPIFDTAGIKRLIVSTYQSVSGAGQKGVETLSGQTINLLNQAGGDEQSEVFPHPIAFNAIPHIDVFTENGYSKEELKIVNETRKILDAPDLKVSATAVRVPIFSCHSEAVNLVTERPLAAEDARELLRHSPGVVVLDQPEDAVYPLAREVAGTDATYVGRIREDLACENGLAMWVVADNLRKGAALNAVQIAEIVVEQWSAAG